MIVIYKYILVVTDTQTIEMHHGASILKVDAQNNIPVLWAIVETRNAKEQVTIRTIGTGHEIDPEEERHLFYKGTYQIDNGSFIGHIFERR